MAASNPGAVFIAGGTDLVPNLKRHFVAEATKLGELYADLAKEAYKPFENQFGKVTAAK